MVSNVIHMKGLHNDRSAPCLYAAVTGWASCPVSAA